jgi:outer membrane protein
MNKILSSVALAGMLTSNMSADMLGFEAGYASWSPDMSGNITYKNSKKDIPNALGIDSYSTGTIWASFEHPFPLIPNIKVQSTKLDKDSGSKKLKLNQTDFIIYYELLENWVNLDFGINLKQFDGNVATSTSDETKFSGIIPLGYIKAKFDLPFSGLSVEADISKLAIGDSSISDIKAGLVYETEVGFGGVLGYKKQTIKLDDLDKVNSDITLKAPYFGVYYHF